jgi:hypothetical protein
MSGPQEVAVQARPGDEHDAGSFSVETLSAVRRGLVASASREAIAAAQLSTALADMCLEAHARRLPAERMVIALKQAWRTTHCPSLVGPADWERTYRDALAASLDLFFQAGTG